MILKMLSFFFEKLIGTIPEPRKTELRDSFKTLLVSVVEAGAKGAVEGGVSGMKNKNG